MKHDIAELDYGQLDAMWNMIRMGYQKSNIPALKEYCDNLRKLMIQKTAGQRKDNPPNYISFGDIGTIVNCIVIEAMCLYLRGDLEKLEPLVNDNVDRTGGIVSYG